jgi:AcrR family transcriptional regulator
MTAAATDHQLLIRAALEQILADPTARSGDANARMARLKASALIECAEKGYAALTIADISRRARISTATIYEDFHDRDALLVAAMELLFDIVARDVIQVPDDPDPVRRIEQLLINHGRVYSEPLTVWIFRLHVTLAWSGYPHLFDIGKRVFEGIDAFWAGLLGQMMDEGLLRSLDPASVVPVLLGPVERCTIISRLACGDGDAGRPTLADVARYGAEALFRIWGGPALATTRGRTSSAELQTRSASADWDAPTRPALSAQLEDALASKAERQTPDDRKARLLLAAAIECQERGYNRANMAEIAARATVSIATVYKHFKDKKTLFFKLLERYIHTRAVPECVLEPGADPIQATLDTLVRQAWLAADPDWVWIANITMASEISGSAPIVDLASTQRQTREAFWTGWLDALSEAGVLMARDRLLAINHLLGAVERTGVLSLIIFGRSAISPDELARQAAASTAWLFGVHGVNQTA